MAGKWRKSSRSGGDQGNCVEARTSLWRKSSRSANSGGTCVEVRATGPVQLRDSKAPQLGTLNMTTHDWRGLLSHVRRLT